MITKALTFISGLLNNFFGANPEVVVLGNIAFANDHTPETAFMTRRLVLSLVNIEEDRISKNPVPYRIAGDDTFRQSPAVYLNLYLLFSANFDAYTDGMESLSKLVEFFQHQNYFTQDNSPTLDPGIEKLIFDMYNLNMEQVYQLWGMLGSKYIPSVLYKMRLVKIQQVEEQPADVIRKVKTGQNIIN